MRLITVLLLLLFSSSNALGAEQSAKAQLKELLNDVNSFSADFAQTVFDEGEMVAESTGTLMLQRPNQMRWQTLAPEENLIIADGDNIWNIDSFVEQVTVFSQQDAVQNNPIMLLTSIDEAEWDKFSIEKVEAEQNALTTEIYAVTALDTDAQIVKLTLRFNDATLVGLQTLDAQQQVSDLQFSAIKLNTVMDIHAFKQDIPDTYTIDDQR